MDKLPPFKADTPNLPLEAENLLELAHRELEPKWRMRALAAMNEGKDPVEFLHYLAAERERVLPIQFSSDHLRVLDRAPAGLIEKIRDVDRHAKQIDQGNWGRIMRCNIDQIEIDAGAPPVGRVLYKILHTPPVGQHNSMLSEAGYLAELHALSEKRPDFRVGVPAPYFFISDPRVDILAMEDVSHATSVKNIIERGVPVPDTFPLEAAFEVARQFVSLMHENNFYHRDLREGNIMLNLGATLESGEPLVYFIDMGFCTKASTEEQAMRGMDKTPDNGMINLVEKRLKTHIKNRESQV